MAAKKRSSKSNVKIKVRTKNQPKILKSKSEIEVLLNRLDELEKRFSKLELLLHPRPYPFSEPQKEIGFHDYPSSDRYERCLIEEFANDPNRKTNIIGIACPCRKCSVWC